jgi:hypothetical protein
MQTVRFLLHVLSNYCSFADSMLTASGVLQGIKNISVQSSVSLQHLPYDKELEKNVEASIAGRLSFATQKLHEIVKAAKDAPTLKDDQIKAGLPDVGKSPFTCHMPTCPCLLKTSCGLFECFVLVYCCTQ